MRSMTVLFAALVVTNCTTKLTPEAQAIRLTSNQDAIKGCDPLGQVTGTDNLNSSGKSEENAHRRMQNAAAKLGANVVLIESAMSRGANGATVRGEAYKCPAAPAP